MEGGDHLHIRSAETVSRLLEGRSQTFSPEELRLFAHYCAGVIDPDTTDSSPSLIIISPDLEEETSPLLDLGK